MINISKLIEKLPEASKDINSSSDNFEINNILENLITDITGSEFSSIWIYNFPILKREKQRGITEISMNLKEGLLYECFALKKSNIYNHIRSEKGYVADIDNPDNIKIKSKIIIPLIKDNECIGLVTAYSSISKIKNFTNSDIEIFKAISPMLIESINRMKYNIISNKEEFIDRRSKDNTDNGKRRRKNDTIENLKVIKQEQEAKSDCKEIVEFTSNIVHDIRTPANGLLGFLEILEEQIEDNRLKEYVSNAKKSALFISDLTTSILDTVSNEIKPSQHKTVILNSARFFSEVADIFSANIYKKRIGYNIFIDPLTPTNIEIDEIKLKRVIINLIGNATKFTPQYGTIKFSISYDKSKNSINISIKDNGIGIAKEKQQEIFEAFKQAEDNTKDNYGGTGLGLAICASYVKDMGGKLLVYSEIDDGSNFYFDLPLKNNVEYIPLFKPLENSVVQISILLEKKNVFVANHIIRYFKKIGLKDFNIKAINHINKIKSDTSHIIAFENNVDKELLLFAKQHHINLIIIEENFLKLKSIDNAQIISPYSYMGCDLYRFVSMERIKKVLIVEDDPISISLLKAILENEYCKIDTAIDGLDGLEKLSIALKDRKPYDIVYTDHNMPNLSGGDMIREYQRLEKNTPFNIKAISISGGVNNQEELKHFNYFAQKPFNKQEILELFKV